MDALVDLLAGRRIVALTGAGCSTESGIPDYRGPGTRERARNPVQYRDFVTDPRARQRYWARGILGWPRFRAARPNDGHRALAALGVPVITQNVDRLHQEAGSPDVIDLHGSLHEVTCLGCGAVFDRDGLQDRLVALNPGWDADVELAPDGDAELGATDGFVVPDCARCGGLLKPRVVFFGENVPRPVVDAAFAWVDAADALLVCGTSLTVFSGMRFVKRAAQANKPIAIVNVGETRGDPLATVRIDGPTGRILPELARRMGRPRAVG